MEFGLLKSKIEKKLVESYSNKTFEKEIKTFKKLVLKNPDVSKAYHIYEELSKDKGFDKTFAEEFVSECIDLYSRIQLPKSKISLLENWVKNIKCENQYKDIDTVLGKSTVIIENIINCKRNIVSKLISKSDIKESINIPLKSVLEIANDSLKNYLSELNESELSEIKKYLTLTNEELNKKYEILSEVAISKLEKMKSENDNETSEKINETINKIKTEKIDSISLLKLKNLTEDL